MEQSRMTQDDVLFGYRLQLFALAAERGVSEACRLMGVHRSTYYRWKHQEDGQGPGDAQAQGASPAADSPTSCRRSLSSASWRSLLPSRLGPKRIATRLARPE